MLAAVLHGAKDLRIEPVGDLALEPDEVRLKIAYGGICGSDLSYYFKGRVGEFAVRHPMILGHEVSGEIQELGSAVQGLAVGTRVALDPSRPCLSCEYCRAGRSNLCHQMRFLGSAAVVPHVQGGFAQNLVVRADQCIPVPDGISMRVVACAEPLAVALHGVRRAGDLLGKRVLVTGSGPVGLLCMRTARLAGALEVCATDIFDPPLKIALTMGAAHVVNVSNDADARSLIDGHGGGFDVALEASGAPSALGLIFQALKRGGRVVQLGMLPSGETPVSINLLQSREFDLVGSFRFHQEFKLAVAMLVAGTVDVTPILSAEFPLAKAASAFAIAGDRTRAIKVHLAIS
jgi:L-idonate 5-dehydrogenase